MDKRDIVYTQYLSQTFHAMKQTGLLLASTDGKGTNNIMAIGWGVVGIIWREPVFMVLVRPSRFTCELIEATKDFTVNVPSQELEEVVSFCGSISGRSCDKFKEQKLTATAGRKVKSPIVDECFIHYECRVIYKSDVVPSELAPDIPPMVYSRGDYHRLFFGHILSVYANDKLPPSFVFQK